MIRSLVIIAVTGFVMSVACISAAIAIGGPDLVKHVAWTWDWDGDEPHMGVWRRMASGPQAQRDFAFSGERLEVDAPAQVDFVQAAGPAKLTISGPATALDQVRVEGGRIVLTPGFHHWDRLHVALTAPKVTRFELNGADRLNIRGYDQETLAIAVRGHGEVTAAGQTGSVELNVSGAGEADLAQLKTAGAAIDISGAGQASVGPTDWAKVQISGMGDVDLLTKPTHLETHVSGAGRIRQPGQDSITAGQSDDDDDGDARGPARPT